MLRYSDKMANLQAQSKSDKEILHDGSLEGWTGTQPTDPNQVPNGVKAIVFTNAGGAFTAGTRSTRQIGKVVVATATNAGTYTIGINPTPSEYSTEAHTYVADGSATVAEVAAGIANVINRDSEFVDAIWDGTDTVWIFARFAGQAFTITEDADPGTDIAVTSAVVANSRANGLAFGKATANVLAKEADVDWKGTVLVTGAQVGWFRWKGNAADDDTARTDLVRMDGSAGTGSADMVMSTTILPAAGTVITLGSFSITYPQVRT